jgi:CDP-diacylglycerol---serine O-phosphatidyltransferase
MSKPVRRADEIEEPSNLYIIHPLSAWLVPYCARAGITPNQVSFAGMGCGIAAGIAYHFYAHTWCVFIGFAFMIAWHVLDGADGQLARSTNSFSEFGKLIDGICDYVTFTAVYIGLALALATVHGGWVWWLVILSGLCHAVQAAAFELQRQYYNVFGLGRAYSALPDHEAPSLPGFAAFLNNTYRRGQLLITGDAAAFHANLAAKLAVHPEHNDAARAHYRHVFAPVIRRWAFLSSNSRTIGIFLCALLGVPLLYFLLEIFLYTAVLMALVADQNRRYQAFTAALETV